MPAYSYKERFVPFVLDGSKPHTIRARRKNPPKPGDKLYHYFGMRTKWCRKLREEICHDVRTIFIGFMAKRPVVIVFDQRLDDLQLATLLLGKTIDVGFEVLSDVKKDRFAWIDGIRPEGTTIDKNKGCFEIFFRFFKQMHGLPFWGDIIYWDPKPLPSQKAIAYTNQSLKKTLENE